MERRVEEKGGGRRGGEVEDVGRLGGGGEQVCVWCGASDAEPPVSDNMGVQGRLDDPARPTRLFHRVLQCICHEISVHTE